MLLVGVVRKRRSVGGARGRIARKRCERGGVEGGGTNDEVDIDDEAVGGGVGVGRRRG